MKNISLAEFQNLSEYQAPNCISLYVVTPEVGAEGHMQPAHLHNAFRKALQKVSFSDKKEEERIEKIFTKIANSEILRTQRVAGFAVFIGSDDYWWYQLPVVFEPFVEVSQRFHLKPLIPMVMQQPKFYVLSLSKQKVQFFKGDNDGLIEEKVEGLPENIEAVVGTETEPNQLQFHTSTIGTGGGKRPAQFHGPSWKDDQQKYLEKFMAAVTSAVTAHLQNKKEKYPLIVAGVERMITEYTNINKNPDFDQKLTILGNFDKEPPESFHNKCLDIIKPFLTSQAVERVDDVIKRDSPDKFSISLTEILKQARLGRIDTLLVTQNQHVWGNFNPDNLQVIQDMKPNSKNSDLLDVACIETLFTNGKVFVVPKEDMPKGALLAAIFRY
jgi:hypothetical protein